MVRLGLGSRLCTRWHKRRTHSSSWKLASLESGVLGLGVFYCSLSSLSWTPGCRGWFHHPPQPPCLGLHVGGEVQCVPLEFCEGNGGVLQVVEEDLDLWGDRKAEAGLPVLGLAVDVREDVVLADSGLGCPSHSLDWLRPPPPPGEPRCVCLSAAVEGATGQRVGGLGPLPQPGHKLLLCPEAATVWPLLWVLQESQGSLPPLEATSELPPMRTRAQHLPTPGPAF